MNKSRLWTKDFLIDSITNLIVYSAYYLLMVTTAVYAMDKFETSASTGGLASGIFILGGLVARTLTGRFIERIGRKKTLFIGLVFFLVTTLLYFEADNLLLLMLVRCLNGAGWGISATATGTIIAGIIPHERLGEGTSYYAMSATIASAIGPFLGILIMQKGSFTIVLTLSIILLAISLTIVTFLKVPEIELTEKQLEEMKRWKLNTFFETRAIPISVVGIFAGIGISSILSFLSTYTRTINLVEAGSLFFIVYATSIMLSRPLTGLWFDQKGENFVMYPSFFLFATGLITISYTHGGMALLIGGVFAGFGYGTFISSAQALAVKSSPVHRMGLATSTFFSFTDIGAGLGPLLLGLLIPVTGFRGLYASAAVVVLLCTFLYYYIHGRKAAAPIILNLGKQDNLQKVRG